MDSIDSIKILNPLAFAQNKAFDPIILKEYIQCQTLEYLSRQPNAAGMTFIGGTCLRLVHGINRFFEDRDFDCKHLDQAMMKCGGGYNGFREIVVDEICLF